MARTDDISRILSIVAGYIPSGIAYGVLATAVQIPWYFTILLSLVVYSGAVQSAFVGFWSLGFEPFSIILTAFLLNLRHTFYGPHLEENYNSVQRKDIAEIGPLLTDEIYALGVSEPLIPISKLKRLAIFSYACWFLGTLTGIISTGGMPPFLLPILYLSLPALFLGLMVPKIKGIETVAAATASIAVAVLFRVYGFPAYFILLSIVAGVVSGVVFSKPQWRGNL